MFIFKNLKVKTTIGPMAVFLILLGVARLGDFLPTVLDNQAEASVIGHETISAAHDVFSTLHEWRSEKVLRTSLQYDPELFYQLTAQDLEDVFGEPVLSRRDGEARVAQYVFDQCAADFYYLSGDDASIVHYEIRQLAGNTSSDCLVEILQNL